MKEASGGIEWQRSVWWAGGGLAVQSCGVAHGTCHWVRRDGRPARPREGVKGGCSGAEAGSCSSERSRERSRLSALFLSWNQFSDPEVPDGKTDWAPMRTGLGTTASGYGKESLTCSLKGSVAAYAVASHWGAGDGDLQCLLVMGWS